MDPSASVHLPTADTGQHLNSAPVQITNSLHPVSQSQTYDDSASHPNNDSTCNRPVLQIPRPPTINPTNISTSHPSDLVLLHHEDKVNYVLDQYCQPVSCTFTAPQEFCKFNRDCIVQKSKILYKGDNITTLSPTVFSSARGIMKKFNYSILDARLIQCFNDKCNNPTTKQPKYFHHVCYMHMMPLKSSKGMDVLEIEYPGDKIIEQIHKNVDLPTVNRNLSKCDTKLIFPVCGKRCYNSVCFYRNKRDKPKESEYAIAQSWDNDGSDTKKSSIDVLINWFTTEENCSRYFGGLDREGRTSTNRKEAYHHHIRDLIEKENGKKAKS
jgi:hypothetical protein